MATHSVNKPKRTGPLTRYRSLHGYGHLDKIGNENSPLALFLMPYAFRDVVYKTFDFLEDTINLDYWAINTGGNATNFAINLGPGGRIQGSTGTTDNGACSLIGPAVWAGDYGCTMEVRWQVNAVTNMYFEMGFIDAATDTSLPITGDLATPALANGAADVAVLAMDTDDTPATACFVTDGSTSNMNTTATVNFYRPGSSLSTWNPVAGVWHTTRISIQGDAASCWIEASTNGSNGVTYYWAGHGDATANQTEGGTAVAPWILFGTRHTTARLATIDYVRIWQNRTQRVVTETIP